MLRVNTKAVANTMQTYTCYNIVILLKLWNCIKGCSLVDRANVKQSDGRRFGTHHETFF